MLSSDLKKAITFLIFYVFFFLYLVFDGEKCKVKGESPLNLK